MTDTSIVCHVVPGENFWRNFLSLPEGVVCVCVCGVWCVFVVCLCVVCVFCVLLRGFPTFQICKSTTDFHRPS